MSVRELHIISNGHQTLETFAHIAQSIHPFVTAFHLREKTKTAAELWQGVLALKEAGVPLEKIIINDRIDVAWTAGVRGIQLAYHSLEVHEARRAFPGLRIGCSVHSVQEAEEKQQQGADFLLFGHVFSTSSKPGLEPRGLDALEEVVKRVTIPVIAIGGIKPDRVSKVIETGAAGIAMMSGILEAANPVQAVRAYFEALHRQGGNES